MLSPDFVRPTSSVLTALRTAKHKRPIVPIRKLSPSISIKTVIHAPGFYDFAQQNLFHARSRATAEISDKRALSTDCSHAAGMTVAHTPCALFPPNLAFGKEGGQACRSRPRKIPRKSRGVYLTFTPLPAPPRRGQWSKSQVHALTFTGNFMRPAAAGLSALLAEGKIGRK